MTSDARLPPVGQNIWREALLTSSLDAVILMDATGALVDFNGEAAKLFGLDRQTAVGRSLSDLIVPPDLRGAHRAGLTRFLATRESRILGRRIEVDAVRADGLRFPVELTVAVLQEEPIIFIAHLRDIQSRVQAERRLRATAAVSQALSTADSPHQAIQDTLQALGESLGWSVLQFWRVPSTGPRLQFEAQWPAIDGDPRFGSTSLTRGDGLPGSVWATAEAQWIEDVPSQSALPRHAILSEAGIRTALAFPVLVHGQVTAVIEAFTEEALPKDAELLAVLAALGGQLGHLLKEIDARAETARARDQAEEANRLKDEFLSMASHELRTPLNAVIGWVHLIRQGRLTGDALMRAIDAIDRNATSQARLVNDLLDMSRIITGKLQLERTIVDPRQILSAALEVVQPAAEAKNIAIDVAIPRSEPVTLYADAGRLQQVFWNVLSNAVKFTPRGGTINVALSFGPDVMQLKVRDTGIGIAPQFLPRVFERFTQADQTPVRVYGGLGLGLSIAKQFMDLHGGTISVTSPGVDQGTEVMLTLPTAAGAASQAQQARDRAETRLAGIRVLVVDDDSGGRERAVSIVDGAGAAAECAASVEEALGCLAQSHYDVMVCAVTGAGRDGAWLAGELEARPLTKNASVKRVAICSRAEVARSRLRAPDARFDCVIEEPITPQALVDAIVRAAGPSS